MCGARGQGHSEVAVSWLPAPLPKCQPDPSGYVPPQVAFPLPLNRLLACAVLPPGPLRAWPVPPPAPCVTLRPPLAEMHAPCPESLNVDLPPLCLCLKAWHPLCSPPVTVSVSGFAAVGPRQWTCLRTPSAWPRMRHSPRSFGPCHPLPRLVVLPHALRIRPCGRWRPRARRWSWLWHRPSSCSVWAWVLLSECKGQLTASLGSNLGPNTAMTGRTCWRGRDVGRAAAAARHLR